MFLKKRWSLLLLKHRRQTAKFQFLELEKSEFDELVNGKFIN